MSEFSQIGGLIHAGRRRNSGLVLKACPRPGVRARVLPVRVRSPGKKPKRPAYAPRTILQSWGFASMGFGVGGALGAKLAAPSQPVVAVVGDGGFMLLPSAVATAVEYQIPVVWVVWNNQGFVPIRDQQEAYFGAGRTLATSFLYHATGDPYTPDYAAMARAMGADGTLVKSPGDLAGALESALASGRPTVLDVHVDPDAKTPAAATWDLPPLPHPAPSFG